MSDPWSTGSTPAFSNPDKPKTTFIESSELIGRLIAFHAKTITTEKSREGGTYQALHGDLYVFTDDGDMIKGRTVPFVERDFRLTGSRLITQFMDESLNLVPEDQRFKLGRLRLGGEKKNARELGDPSAKDMEKALKMLDRIKSQATESNNGEPPF